MYCHFRSPKQSPRRSPGYTRRDKSLSASNSEEESDQYAISTDDELLQRKPKQNNYQRLEKRENQVHSRSPTIDKSYTLVPNLILVLILVASLIGILIYNYWSTPNPTPNAIHKELYQTFREIEKHFDKQDADFWRSIRVNIEEITALKKPSTIIFLYENNAKSTIKAILNEVANAALCDLTECQNEPVLIQGSSLNSSNFIDNYGILISTFREPLTKNGVLIVENLEQVPGKAAQAFHNFCDDYDPVVDKALILFTLKVEKLPINEHPPSYLRRLLSKVWSDIKMEDKFNPLFSRISGTILLVRPE